MMDEREIDSHNRGPLPNTVASESVTTAIDEAERQNRQRAITMAAGAVVFSLLTAFVLLQVFSGGDESITAATSAEPSTSDTPASDPEDAVAFDNDEPVGDVVEEAADPSVDESPASMATTQSPSSIDVSGYAAPDNPVGDQPMTLRGMGDVALGMTVAEAEAAIGGTIIEPTVDGSGCVQTRIGGDALSPVLMVIGTGDFGSREIVRIDMVSGNSTRSGIGIGSLASEVIDTYGERIEINGDILTYVPADEADADYRIVLDIVGDVVLSARAGELPYATWIGCES